MRKRTKSLISLLLTLAMVLTINSCVFAYPVAPDGALASDAVPDHVFATPDKVQGFAADRGRVFLSRSGAFAPSSSGEKRISSQRTVAFLPLKHSRTSVTSVSVSLFHRPTELPERPSALRSNV